MWLDSKGKMLLKDFTEQLDKRDAI
ncbi:hypothetical protein [Lysinibacillus sp. 38-6]